jgi:DNA polymerase I-like protein with 3'-5' exonuclease and polymerase domains
MSMVPIVVDFESFFSKEYSLSKISTQEYIYSDLFKIHGCGVAIGQEQPRWFSGDLLKRLLERVVPNGVIVCHNANFDAAILAWHYGLKPKLIIDTVSLSRAVIGERLRSHSLSSIAEYLLKQEKGGYLSSVMGVRDLTAEQEQLLAQYCLHDVDLCRQIFYTLIPHLPKKELLAMDMVSRMFTEPSLILDQQLLVEYHSQVVANKMNLMDYAGVESAKELNSNPQFAEALKRLGVEPPTKISPTTGKETWAFARTDSEFIALEEHKDERVQALVAARLGTKSTLNETRAATLIKAAPYGAFSVSYLFSGAQTTHRLSGSGNTNFQNLPRGGTLRKAIMAPEGHTLIVADLAQIELRATLALARELIYSIDKDAAARSEESNALNILECGGDLYGHFGSIIYQETITKETHPLERQVAKSAVLGLGFGMGAPKFLAYCKQQNIAMDEETAERIVKLYRGTYTGVVRLWRYMQDSVKQFLFDGIAKQLFKEPDVWVKHTSLYGDPCIGLSGALQIKYPGLAYDPEQKQFMYQRAMGPTKMFAGKYVENLVQYLARQVIMEQTVTINKKYKVAMSTHDEICVPVLEEDSGEAAAWIRKVMTTSPTWWKSLPLGVELHTANRYGEAK